jgi:signal transduction histidine kinase
MRLLIHLILRLIGVVLLCLACTIGWVLVDAHRSIEADTNSSADRVAATLQNLYWRDLLWRDGAYRNALLPVPDWESIATMKSIAPGICIRFTRGAEPPREICSQTDGVGSPAPSWFVRLYGELFGAHGSVARPLTVRQRDAGAVEARAEPAAAVRQAWHQVTVMVGIAAAMALAIGLLAALLIGHALLPARGIVRGLRRLEQGDHRHRLPAFGASEFNHIAHAVNDLASRLAATTAERIALTKRLFEVQEEERRALARDLHDEFGQCLTATAALAAAIEAGAESAHPDVAEDARAIARITRQMMATLRGALARLRSQDLEELGLQDSLVQLVARWNAGTTRRATFHLDVSGDLGAVPAEAAVNVYRIAQECLTNAARHGKPHHVHLRVINSDDSAVALSVEDDGGGDASAINAASGHGILGIRERIAALGGSLSIAAAAHGVRVAAVIPLVLSRSSPTAATA